MRSLQHQPCPLPAFWSLSWQDPSWELLDAVLAFWGSAGFRGCPGAAGGSLGSCLAPGSAFSCCSPSPEVSQQLDWADPSQQGGETAGAQTPLVPRSWSFVLVFFFSSGVLKQEPVEREEFGKSEILVWGWSDKDRQEGVQCRYKNIQSHTHPMGILLPGAWTRRIYTSGRGFIPKLCCWCVFASQKRGWGVDKGQEPPCQGLCDPNPALPPWIPWEGSGELAEGGGPAWSSRNSSWSWAGGPGWDFWDALGREQRLSEVMGEH